jgi:hypothetical protein
MPNCPEGAIQIIDNKARLISDLFCDGLGACLGHCPEGAITIEEREAEKYDEKKVMENIIKQGPSTVEAHLHHLREHGQAQYLSEAIAVLKEKNLVNPIENPGFSQPARNNGCPGSRSMTFARKAEAAAGREKAAPSELSHWPVQLHLISPQASHYSGSDMVLAADCAAFSHGDFHQTFLKGKTLAIACPKLDDGQETYVEKITALIDLAKINSLTVITMQVPCCSGLLHIAREGQSRTVRKIPLKYIVISVQGEVLKEEWL